MNNNIHVEILTLYNSSIFTKTNFIDKLNGSSNNLILYYVTQHFNEFFYDFTWVTCAMNDSK